MATLRKHVDETFDFEAFLHATGVGVILGDVYMRFVDNIRNMRTTMTMCADTVSLYSIPIH
jgi:hypothetical protein